MNGLNGIIVDGKVYEIVKSYNCSDCGLLEKCTKDAETFEAICYILSNKSRSIFRFSQNLTDKLNGNGIQQEDTSAGL